MIKLTTSDPDLTQAAAILKSGGLAVFPTETVYGLGADAFNTQALARVFEVKGRPRFDPLIIHIAGLSALERIADLDALASPERTLLEKLTRQFWPGPLTLVLPKRPEVPDLATAGLPTAAIRLPAHPAARKLIELAGGAVAAPSANRFGRLSPTRAEHAKAELGDLVDCIVDGGPCSVGVESTVLQISGHSARILRPGGISREQLEKIAGQTLEGGGTAAGPKPGESDPAAGNAPAASPGMMKSHYAPERPLSLHQPEEMLTLPPRPEDGYLFFSGKSRDAWLERTNAAAILIPHSSFLTPHPPEHIAVLSEQGSAVEAAANLFEYLRRLDGKNIRRIHAEALPEENIGAAVNDRLRRASDK